MMSLASAGPGRSFSIISSTLSRVGYCSCNRSALLVISMDIADTGETEGGRTGILAALPRRIALDAVDAHLPLNQIAPRDLDRVAGQRHERIHEFRVRLAP